MDNETYQNASIASRQSRVVIFVRDPIALDRNSDHRMIPLEYIVHMILRESGVDELMYNMSRWDDVPPVPNAGCLQSSTLRTLLLCSLTRPSEAVGGISVSTSL